MTKTFKRQVEEIEYRQCQHQTEPRCPRLDDRKTTNCHVCKVNDILTAHNAELDRIAEGCNKFKEKNANNVPYIKHDANRRIDKCQAYIQAQKEGM
jgi:hypothetical protein